MKIDFILFP